MISFAHRLYSVADVKVELHDNNVATSDGWGPPTKMMKGDG